MLLIHSSPAQPELSSSWDHAYMTPEEKQAPSSVCSQLPAVQLPPYPVLPGWGRPGVATELLDCSHQPALARLCYPMQPPALPVTPCQWSCWGCWDSVPHLQAASWWTHFPTIPFVQLLQTEEHNWKVIITSRATEASYPNHHNVVCAQPVHAQNYWALSALARHALHTFHVSPELQAGPPDIAARKGPLIPNI